MVAIITGNGAGLEKSSAKILGAQGVLGSAALGAANNQVFVNAANGNLVITRADEFLVGRGPVVEIDQTYNSQGDLSDDNGDNWRPSVYQRVTGLTGTVNTAGSTVQRVDWDGSVQLYTYNSGSGAYTSTDDAGAYDSMSFSGTTWTWKDGSGLIRGTYDSSNNGRDCQDFRVWADG
ncbi:hypothetical protein GCM10009087_26410 [Sphingomonas oligophenolica]|uniref:Uncharacterized protein n=1 Tax=Sphingomonas oligophenolica TaxID=301154 RepID=A0ABU9Y812_9SPHN